MTGLVGTLSQYTLNHSSITTFVMSVRVLVRGIYIILRIILYPVLPDGTHGTDRFGCVPRVNPLYILLLSLKWDRS